MIEEYGAQLYVMDTRQLFGQACYVRNYEKLSFARRQKVDSYRFMKDKRLCLGAGMLLDRGLANYGLKEKTAVVTYGEYGKPYLSEYPWIYFNLSHSEEMVLAVFAPIEIGCDVELVHQADLALAERFFCAGEFEYVAGKPEGEERNRAFYRIWTLKESFVKAVGLGMSLPFNDFEIQVGQEGKIKVRQSVDSAVYLFQEYTFGDYCGAVCFRQI